MTLQQNATQVISWLDKNKFNYNINIFKSNPLHGQYYLDFKNQKEELLTRLRWGIA